MKGIYKNSSIDDVDDDVDVMMIPENCPLTIVIRNFLVYSTIQ